MIHQTDQPKHSETALQVAAYIVGCLVHEGCIKIDQQSLAPYEVLESSIRVVAANLDALGIVAGDAPELPVDW
jgi:hypothetical protein